MRTIKVDGRDREVFDALSCGPGCVPHTYEIRGGYVEKIAGVWWMQEPGQFKRQVEVSL